MFFQCFFKISKIIYIHLKPSIFISPFTVTNLSCYTGCDRAGSLNVQTEVIFYPDPRKKSFSRKDAKPMEHYYQPEIECASREQIRAWQDERLVKTVKHVYDNVEFYRKKMEAAGVTPDDIKSVDDLHKLPFLTKDDLRDAYPSSPPAAPPAAAWWPSTPSTTSICGTTAAPAPSSRPAEPKTMSATSATATACSPEARALTAAPPRWAA